ncbi:MAG: PhoH family protein, partial [Nitrospirae bacterium]|nr:PhoH family protein [Nitrospirota bacterium]
MSKSVITKIRLSENIDIPAFYGSHDANLRLIEELFDVKVVARGDELSVEGDAEAVEKIENLIADINEMAEGGFTLKQEDAAFAINSIKREPKVSVKKIFLDTIPVSSKKRFITPKSANQRKYADAMRKNDLVIGIGPAGTGKTYLAMAMAVSALIKKEVSRIVLARPAVEAGEKLGYLPGDMFEKVHPYLRPLYDALFDMIEFDKANRLIERGAIEIAPLAFMRGRTLNDSFVILDEAQNATSEQMKMFLTRLKGTEKGLEKTREDKEHSQMKRLKIDFKWVSKIAEDRIWPILLLGISVVLLLGFLLIPGGIFSAPRLIVGDVVQKSIKAPVDLTVRDEATIKKNQKKAEDSILSIYDFDANAVSQIEARFASGFEDMRIALEEHKRGEIAAKTLQDREMAFVEKLGIPLSIATLKTLQAAGYNKDIQGKTIKILTIVMEKGIVADRYFLEADKEKGIVVRSIGDNRESHVRNLSNILDVKEANKQILRLAASFFPSSDSALKNAVSELCAKMLGPNLMFNKIETEARKKEAVANVKPLFYKIKKGEIILKNGQRVTEEHITILEEISKYQRKSYLFQVFFGIILIVSLIIYTFYRDIMRYKNYLPFDLSKFLLMGILIVGNVAITKFFYFLLGSFAEKYEFINNTDIIFAIPVVIGPMLTAILFDIHIAIVFSFINSLFMGVLIREEQFYVIFSFIGGIVAAFSVIQCKKRSALQRAGLFVGLINILIIIAI